MAVLGVLIDHPESVAGGIALYPVSDAASLAGATHRFEAHYNDTLIGPLGDPRYRERSMVGRADLIQQPLLLMHGTDDPVVPVGQSRALRDTLHASGVEVRYIEFEGEGHGLRNPEYRRREYELVGAFLDDVVDG
jgi:dipeptidyl aminopeptidase/acylaminoacyl peptidase